MHVDGRVDPVADAETIQTELVLADLGSLERSIPKLEKDAKRDKELAARLAVAKRLQAWLDEGHRAADLEMSDDERAAAHDLFLLTMKPVLYVANCDEDQLGDKPMINGKDAIPICAEVEAELADLDPEESAEFLESMGLELSGLETLAQAAYRLLGLQSFFTAGTSSRTPGGKAACKAASKSSVCARSCSSTSKIRSLTGKKRSARALMQPPCR